MSRRDPNALEILKQDELATIQRSDSKQVRITRVSARKPNGSTASWISIWAFYLTDSGEWKATRSGITIRPGELAALAETLITAVTDTVRERHADDDEPGEGEPARR